jgi:hypothetical protein
MRAICENAMAADPNVRYQSAREMTANVTDLPECRTSECVPGELARTCEAFFARHRTAVLPAVVYLLMRVLFILFARR